MRLFTTFISGDMLETASFLLNKSLVLRMMIISIPLISLSLFLVFFLTCNEIETIVTTAIARNEQMHAESLAQTFEQLLLEAGNHLRVLAAGDTDKKTMLTRLNFRKQNDIFPYREIAYASSRSDDRYVLVNIQEGIKELPLNIINNTPNSPFETLESADLKPDTVKISMPLEVSYKMIPGDNKWHTLTFHVIRLSAPVFDDNGQPQGVLILSLDLKIFRDYLSKESTIMPTLSEDSTPQKIRSFFFDYYGWILFQSEDYDEEKLKNLPLSSESIRLGLKGDNGRRGYGDAFRPAPNYTVYQEMVEQIQNGHSGHSYLPRGDEGWSTGQTHAECVSYAPIKFVTSASSAPEVIGGLAFLDNSFISSRTYRHILTVFSFCFILALILLLASIWWIGRGASRRLLQLSEQVHKRNEAESTDPISLPPLPLELESIRKNVDNLLVRLRRAKSENASQLARSHALRLNEPVENLPSLHDIENQLLVGSSSCMETLKAQIEKISQISADVLIVGETGTGKELVSQALHSASDRRDKPFISINCGALDENLLMDTLFGHVKGAFTEAKQQRKGAFIAAEGGTLLLDEIGNAAPKVQQALLRALSIRSIRPLGSDHDIPFNARIIAATNADLRNDGKEGNFRNDLYFRLAVISIHTPALRERKEDIPALVVHFMAQALQQEGKGLPSSLPLISRGAMEKLMNYNWPGNVRELKNVITRAMAFYQNDILQADDILLDDQNKGQSETIHQNPSKPVRINIKEFLPHLNARQQAILPTILEKGHITRQEYQKLAPEAISMRTAQYDLQQMVHLGILLRKGRGPSMSYLVAQNEQNT
ncbi:MAG: sigma 54-interacting transcriptional regulator [Desulfovibrio sp.]|nr:sigma 54-interacting transcriptional regulator [Desulfovibrio sp.]